MEITVKPASALEIKAPEGNDVAVIDQSWVAENPAVAQVQDHHIGLLKLVAGEPVWPLKVQGKFYIPADAKVIAKSLLIGILSQGERKWTKLAEAPVSTQGATGEWVDFESTMPLLDKNAVQGRIFLVLSAVPLAGPVYLDSIHVTDSGGNELWESPSFE